MNEQARKIATYDDLYSVPENMIGEIINGELIVSPRPSPEHSNAASSLGGALIPPYKFGKGGPGGWIILDEVEIKLDEDTFVPDISGWKKERYFKPKDQNWVSVTPDWVCEVLSPSSIRYDRIVKAKTYAKHQIPYFWIIDPFSETLEVLKNETGMWSIIGTYSNDDKVRAEPFQEVEIDLSGLWFENTLVVVKSM